jgi:hypothetical protein
MIRFGEDVCGNLEALQPWGDGSPKLAQFKH